ncbi:conserved hypothetical protein [Pyrenophora tritici-repentis Pt-1C-BFP]|uniref:Polynucleotide 5'-hydroxyl-kinase GRC3 n=1 Tax=Pyrenophora tritici-repentis (strain Pt-1C-BFP) TaxID=426418 RepID=B2VXN7_PYRTR|nr:uncharacterized protein PTRG_03283 [Pyrenophora tritici-repentis Pt-1C-BFP]EDU45806.1 conserved hypothetical protein [Pyrenophora tritici-repentis Pt-1C-BFP]
MFRTPAPIFKVEKMSGKRKRGEDPSSGSATSGKPLTAIAAARLRSSEAAAKVVKPAEIPLEQVAVPASPLLQSKDSDVEEVESEEEVALVQHNVKLCNWRSEPQNILSETDTELKISLSKHTTIALIGCFDFTVLRGAVNINGANIGTVSRDGQKNRVHRAYVPATHPILKIRGLDGTNHIQIKTCKEPAPLASISPLFKGLWNEDRRYGKKRSFRIVTHSDVDILSRPLRPEVTPEDWLRAIEDCTSTPSITIVTGSSSSGKSTYARRLVNRSLTGLGKTAPSVPAVCYMDLDPKKQEHAPGGQISLVVVRDLNLGPSFTHPSAIPASKEATTEIIRAHLIPTNFANYAEYYQSCVEDLFLAYKTLRSRDTSLPLVIDTPAFLYTSEFEILSKLLTRLKPHNMVLLHDTRATDTETSARLQLLQTTGSQYHGTVYGITAQKPLSVPIRTENELCAMQMQSYFHLKSSSMSTGQPQTLSWTPEPLSHLVPWEFCYEETAERSQDLAAFALYSEPVESSSLVHALNGSVIQIIQSTSSVVSNSLPRTQKYRIPYLAESERTGMVEPLDPRLTRLVCTALIRGFNPDKRVVEVLVPKTHESLLYNLSPDRTVFVGGCSDVPEWAFLEDAYAKKATTLPLWVEKEDVIDKMGYMSTLRSCVLSVAHEHDER